MRHPCWHNDTPPSRLSERGLDIYQGEDCARCCQAAVDRDIAAGRRDAEGKTVNPKE